jgi:hypothetical protein
MKKLITFLSILTTVAILALPVAARNAVARPDNSLQDQCSQEAKDALYQSFLKNRQADQAKAFEDAKKYLACPAGQVTEAQQKIIDYLKKWSTTYEKEVRKVQLPILLYNDQKYPEAYALGKQILADEPDNLYVLVHLGASGASTPRGGTKPGEVGTASEQGCRACLFELHDRLAYARTGSCRGSQKSNQGSSV